MQCPELTIEQVQRLNELTEGPDEWDARIDTFLYDIGLIDCVKDIESSAMLSKLK